VLAFVTSLPHPANCASYRKRSLLLADTLGSILRQRDQDIHVIIVANAPPECPLPDDPRLEVVQVAFPPKESPVGKPSLVGIERDKGAKLGMGTSYAVRRGAQHVMYVDSDDYIHRDIAGVAAGAPDAAGWYFDSGYFHIRGQRSVTPIMSEFHQRNGSTHVLRTDLLDVPADLDPALPRDEVLERVGRNKAVSIMGRHRPIVQWFEDLGAPLAPFPFPAAIWEIGTGENCTGVFAAAGRQAPVAGAISEDFGLPVPSRLTSLASELATARARVARRLRPGD
jgi:hypothetical protein